MAGSRSCRKSRWKSCPSTKNRYTWLHKQNFYLISSGLYSIYSNCYGSLHSKPQTEILPVCWSTHFSFGLPSFPSVALTISNSTVYCAGRQCSHGGGPRRSDLSLQPSTDHSFDTARSCLSVMLATRQPYSASPDCLPPSRRCAFNSHPDLLHFLRTLTSSSSVLPSISRFHAHADQLHPFPHPERLPVILSPCQNVRRTFDQQTVATR